MSSTKPTFPAEKHQALRDELKAYFLDELDLEIGSLQTDLLIEFLTKNVGQHFYNQGVMDAQQVIKEKAADLVLLLNDE